MAFGVRQRGSTTVDAAVAATLELETYLRKPIATVPIAQVERNAQDDDVIVLVGRGRSDRSGAQDSMQKVLDRLEKIEEQLKTEHVALENKQNSRRVPRPRKRNNQKVLFAGDAGKRAILLAIADPNERIRETRNPWSSEPCRRG